MHQIHLMVVFYMYFCYSENLVYAQILLSERVLLDPFQTPDSKTIFVKVMSIPRIGFFTHRIGKECCSVLALCFRYETRKELDACL